MNIVERIEKHFLDNGFQLLTGINEVNIVYLEGVNLDFTLNDDIHNVFNDVRLVLTRTDEKTGKLEISGKWQATSEPGNFYTYNPMNELGCARIEFGQYKAWSVGIHGNSEPHEALIQVDKVTVCRDLNKDFIRVGDKRYTGCFGINQHHGYDLPVINIGKASAGCLVGRTRKGHKEFMKLVMSDPNYVKNKNHIFYTTIINGEKLFST